MSSWGEQYDRKVQLAQTVELAGNPQALRDWYNSGAAEKINWGTDGDHTRCVEIASKYMTTEQAHGFCNLRSKDATGHYSGEKAAQNQGGSQPRLNKAERQKYPKLKK